MYRPGAGSHNRGRGEETPRAVRTQPRTRTVHGAMGKKGQARRKKQNKPNGSRSSAEAETSSSGSSGSSSPEGTPPRSAPTQRETPQKETRSSQGSAAGRGSAVDSGGRSRSANKDRRNTETRTKQVPPGQRHIRHRGGRPGKARKGQGHAPEAAQATPRPREPKPSRECGHGWSWH